MNRYAASPVVRAGTLFSFLLLLVASAAAQNVAVLPGRIVLDSQKRTATAFVTNRGDQEGTFRVSLSYWRMDEHGQLSVADSLAESSDNFAGPVLRYSPRRMVIPPGGSQTLRLLVRRPPGMDIDDWEYHAHLSIRSVPTVPKLKEVADPTAPEVADAIVTRPVVSVETMVPVIVRIGRPEVELELVDTYLEVGEGADAPVLRMELARRGERSVYGHISYDYIGVDGTRTNLIENGGMGIYTEVDRRFLKLNFARWPRLNPFSGQIELDFRETAKGRGDLVLTETIALDGVPRR